MSMNFLLCSPDRIQETDLIIVEGKTIDMVETKEKYLGREVYSKHSFNEKGTFQSLYAAHGWLSCYGYTYGSLDCGRGGASSPVAICKGEYDLPQKWHNLSESEKNGVVGVIASNDFREGVVTIILFED